MKERHTTQRECYFLYDKINQFNSISQVATNPGAYPKTTDGSHVTNLGYNTTISKPSN